jgi:hypothetical protein
MKNFARFVFAFSVVSVSCLPQQSRDTDIDDA